MNYHIPTDDLSCLVDGINGQNYIEYNDFDEVLNKNNINGVRDEICESRTPSQTPLPTSEPTPSPTNNPTPNPVDPVCEYNYTSCVVISVSSDNNCGYLRRYLQTIARETYSNDYVDLTILLHGRIYGNEISGRRNEILSSLSDDSTEFLCNSSSYDSENDNSTDYNGTLESTLDQIVDNDLYDEKKVIMISLCTAPDDDNTCNVARDYDLDNEQFNCIIEDDGNKEGDNYISNDTDDSSNLKASDVFEKLYMW